MMRRFVAAFFAGVLLLAAQGSAAQDAIPPSPIVHAQLHVDAGLVKRGKPVDAAVTFTMPEHWHIYWKNPGDSGIATKLEWSLPKDLKAGEIEWPAPERIEMTGLVNYGYSYQVTLPVQLMPEVDDLTGEVKVKASWLVCKDICIPESAELTGLLKGDALAASMIAQARARVPMPFKGSARFTATTEQVELIITQRNPWGVLEAARLSPVEDGIITNLDLPRIKTVGNELTLTFKRGAADAVNDWHGVLHITRDGVEEAFDLVAQNTVPGATTPSPNPLPQGQSGSDAAPLGASLITILLLAFLGGLILNIMPCVLPILALKALALAKKAQASRAAAAKQGLGYTAGVVASFLLIAAVMLALKAGGHAIGWGFQLQNPLFVGFLLVVMLAVSANLLGLFTLPSLFGTKATGVDDSTVTGSFLTGGLAVLVATPCTAPFMATAIGATLALPMAQALLVFAALGLGMASPFLLISLWPAARRLLPKPGAWMLRFKHLLAIPMLATAAWLLWVLVQIVSPSPIAKTDLYEPYSAVRLAELREAGKPVLVDATAAWCITCKINERVALKPAEMQAFLRSKNVMILVADWTNSDPEITHYLAGFGRNGVPLVVYYPPHGEPVVLPQVLTPALVKAAINGIDAKN